MLRQGFDVEKDPLQDLCLMMGFLRSLLLVLRVVPKGLIWLAVPCNSFTNMSYFQHRRKMMAPYGRLIWPFVNEGNMICARSCLLVVLAVARSASWFCENPLRSALDCWPYLNYLIHQPWINAHRVSWCLNSIYGKLW